MHRLDIATYFTSAEGSNERPPVLDDDDLRSLYGYPDASDRPWMRLNFVASIDGAVSVDGASAGLGTPADKTVFRILRELADVVLVGAGTARAENYGGARPSAEAVAWRRATGRADVPPIAVVTASGLLDPQSRLFTDTAVPPVVFTTTRADPRRLSELRETGADVEVLGAEIAGGDILAALHRRGLCRVLCEGGPGLFGTLVADDAVDELCLTTSPQLVAGTAPRIAVSPGTHPTAMTRTLLLGDDDGTLLTRWVRPRAR